LLTTCLFHIAFVLSMDGKKVFTTVLSLGGLLVGLTIEGFRGR